TRNAIRSVGVVARMSKAFAIAPMTQPIAISFCALMTSGRLRAADRSVPTTKPPCTAMVSHAVVAGVSLNSAEIAPLAAVAENHNGMPRNIARDSQASCARGEQTLNTERTQVTDCEKGGGSRCDAAGAKRTPDPCS